MLGLKLAVIYRVIDARLHLCVSRWLFSIHHKRLWNDMCCYSSTNTDFLKNRQAGKVAHLFWHVILLEYDGQSCINAITTPPVTKGLREYGPDLHTRYVTPFSILIRGLQPSQNAIIDISSFVYIEGNEQGHNDLRAMDFQLRSQWLSVCYILRRKYMGML